MSAKPRKRAPRRRRGVPFGRLLARALEVGVCLAILGGTSFGFYSFANRSDYFKVKHVRVEGLKVLSEKTVLKAAGITSASNILFLKPEDIRRRIDAVPYVRDCTVTTVFPDTVIIRITERRAVATLLTHNQLYAVDADGRILKKLAMDQPRVGPLITNVPDEGPIEPGQTLEQRPLHEALAVWAAFSRSRTATELHVSELSAPKADDIRMFCDELPYSIRWGRGDYQTQAERLDILWAAKKGKLGCTEYLDLRFGQDLVCK